MKRWLAVVLGGALAVGAAAAQQATIDASVDRPVIHDNESFTYTIRAEGSVRGEPELGVIKQTFDVLASSSEKRIGIVNGRTSEVTTWTYELMPKRAGEFTLPLQFQEFEPGRFTHQPLDQRCEEEQQHRGHARERDDRFQAMLCRRLRLLGVEPGRHG